MILINLSINGKKETELIEDDLLLVELLREKYNLTGTHVGCDTSQCGACTVHVDNMIYKSCTVLAAQVNGCKITTIEGLSEKNKLHAVQEAFQECHALQCGFCTPGMIMTISHFLREKPVDLSKQFITKCLAGNICRCTGYVNIIKAFRVAAIKLYPELKLSRQE
jgi:carbon-monoxide dehydrogenase small subunit